MQAAGCVEALIERAEDHREHGAEGSMESANRIRERIRLLLDGSGNPWMCELQQQRAARAQEYRSLPVHPPGHRSRTEYAREWTGRRTAYQIQLALECFRAHDFERITLRCQHHDLTASAPSSARARDVRTQYGAWSSFASAAAVARPLQRRVHLLSPAGDRAALRATVQPVPGARSARSDGAYSCWVRPRREGCALQG